MPVALTLPFAAMQISLGDANTWIVIGVILFLLFSLSFGLMLITRYRRCPSNKVLVIYGKVAKGESAKCLHGGGAFVWPLVQAYEYLDLEPIQIEVPLRGALSSENIRVNVPSYFTVAIGTAPEIMQNAAIRLLGLKTEEVKGQALDIIFGQLRQVIASMPIEAINRDRDVFLKNIQESLEPELEKIGLVLINVNITDITDESGYIEALGRKAASEAIQKAEVDVAEQVKLGAIGVKGAERDREIEVARAVKLREIGTKDAEREMAVRVAELGKARAVGEQTALYEQEARIKEAERAKRIEVAKANAEAVTGENLSKALIADSEAELKVKQAEAYAVGETRHREAEAAVLAAQYRAQALAAAANATRVEAEQRAQFEAPARAQKARITVEAEAEAERLKLEAAGRASAIALEAEGEAKAIYAKLEAQARGEYEILAKKGEGLREIVEGCGGAEAAFKLMMLEHLDHLAETASKAIANVKFDKVIVWDGGNGSGGASGFLSGLGRSIPPLMDIMRNLGGVELPDYLGRMVEQPPAGGVESEPADGAKPAAPA
ncbi:MAG TPA: SPFH domain-containing protein, partial [Planctomycetota bacterium]|nr:SPFH domain-containing protein [Planctomycetota bacterium]